MATRLKPNDVRSKKKTYPAHPERATRPTVARTRLTVRAVAAICFGCTAMQPWFFGYRWVSWETRLACAAVGDSGDASTIRARRGGSAGKEAGECSGERGGSGASATPGWLHLSVVLGRVAGAVQDKENGAHHAPPHAYVHRRSAAASPRAGRCRAELSVGRLLDSVPGALQLRLPRVSARPLVTRHLGRHLGHGFAGGGGGGCGDSFGRRCGGPRTTP